VEKLLTIKQLSELIQYSPKTIYQWTHIGYIPHLKLKKGIRFKETEVDLWLSKKRKQGRDKYKIVENSTKITM
jgi:excisionase family DNA binding protein